MKKPLVYCASLCMLYPCVPAWDVSLVGTADEVESQLYHLFPLGTAKSEIPQTMDERLGLRVTRYLITTSPYPSFRYIVGKEPGNYQSRNGDVLPMHSSLKMIAKYYYNSTSRVDVVVVDFLFDENSQLIWIEVHPESVSQ